ncbi:hypothetical protein IQ07DRAFT_594392 [Pyrenochaeta sp. DS3sAY3a]|nr:hypothetical protein IQ07DRAFT_594392 [Pyrenochaeta sp. DS3sAY3a]
MARNLLQLPPELLVEIVAFLQVRDLLRLAQTCHFAQSLAYSNLRSLVLGMQHGRTANPLSARRSIRTPPSPRTLHPTDPHLSRTHRFLSNHLDPSTVWVRIRDAHEYDSTTLFALHDSLTQNILSRHGSVLHKLTLSLWTLTPAVAAALAQLPALRALSLSLQTPLHGPPVPRSRISDACPHTAQRKAWGQLSVTAVWRPRLCSLRLENADLGVRELGNLLGEAEKCGELVLSSPRKRRPRGAGARYIGGDLWTFLGERCHGGTELRRLVLDECGGLVDGRVCATVEILGGLEYLDLRGCYTSDGVIEHWEKCGWPTFTFFPPGMQDDGRDMALEVDPAYVVDFG